MWRADLGGIKSAFGSQRFRRVVQCEGTGAGLVYSEGSALSSMGGGRCLSGVRPKNAKMSLRGVQPARHRLRLQARRAGDVAISLIIQ